MNDPTNMYATAQSLAAELEAELKRLRRWGDKPLPKEKFEDMGAFGMRTMSFEQWLQFVLIPRIQEIVSEKGEFPKESMVAAHAIRELDGDPDPSSLHDILYKLDTLINKAGRKKSKGQLNKASAAEPVSESKEVNDTVQLGSENIPAVLFTLAELLPKFTGADLESQLQTFDTFLAILSANVRPALSQMISQAAMNTSDPAAKQRLEQASQSINDGGRAAEPYDHEAAMKKYREDHKKAFPDSE